LEISIIHVMVNGRVIMLVISMEVLGTSLILAMPTMRAMMELMQVISETSKILAMLTRLVNILLPSRGQRRTVLGI
jgi:hypothetical protein